MVREKISPDALRERLEEICANTPLLTEVCDVRILATEAEIGDDNWTVAFSGILGDAQAEGMFTAVINALMLQYEVQWRTLN